jgi:hypothetical protein
MFFFCIAFPLILQILQVSPSKMCPSDEMTAYQFGAQSPAQDDR